MRILVTGADTISGQTVIRHLVARGVAATGLVLGGDEAKSTIEELGAAAIVGDVRDGDVLRAAMAQVERVYHICADWHPDEADIGAAVIAAARDSNVELFGYHSAVAPHLEDVPSHWAKMQVQMALMQSGLAFSVFQPAAYMQGLQQAVRVAVDSGELAVPFDVDARLTWVDAEDAGEAIATVMARPQQQGGTYELCGTAAPLSARDIAAGLSAVSNQPIEARACSPEAFDPDCTELRKSYWRFVDRYGMRAGNPNVLAMLLGRPPVSFEQYLARVVEG